MAQTVSSEEHHSLPEARGLELDLPAAREQQGGLLAIAEAIRAAKGDFQATVERMAQDMGEKDRQQLLGEMTNLEEQHPGAFLAGALAGFALGRSAAAADAAGPSAAVETTEASENPGTPDEQEEPSEAGVVTGPIDTAQTGTGGPGYLEPPHETDDR